MTMNVLTTSLEGVLIIGSTLQRQRYHTELKLMTLSVQTVSLKKKTRINYLNLYKGPQNAN